MGVKKQKYRRLQVENIALRTVFEIVMLIAATVICCVAVINNYENSYAHSSTDTAELSAMQLAHNISVIADRDALMTENADRREYVSQVLCMQLEKCFIGDDVQYSGGIFTVDNSDIELFASSDAFGKLYANLSENTEFTNALLLASAGEQVNINIGDTYIALYPIADKNSAFTYAISSAAVDFRSSTEFDSPVKNRIVLISIVSGLLILGYFTISGIRSERKKISGEAV